MFSGLFSRTLVTDDCKREQMNILKVIKVLVIRPVSESRPFPGNSRRR